MRPTPASTLLLRSPGPLLLLALVAACGPGKSMSEGDDESASASASDTTTTTGDASATDTDADTDTTTGALEIDFPCDGARWLTVHRPGEFIDLAVDSRGHVLGFGILGHEGDPNDALITDFNASGALVRNVLYASNSDDGVRAGGVDGSDQVYALVLEKGEPWLRKHDTDGVVAWALPLLEAMNAGFEPTELAVGPDGSSVLGGLTEGGLASVIVKFDGAGAKLWEIELPGYVQIHGINAAGAIAATRGAAGVMTLAADGSVLWDVDWPLFNPGHADINASGEVAIAGETDDGLHTITVARFDGAGALVHDETFTIVDSFDKVSDLDLNDAGEVAISGYVQGPSPLTAFVVELDAAGARAATHVCDEAGDTRGYAVAISEAGEVYLGGAAAVDDFTYRSFAAAFE